MDKIRQRRAAKIQLASKTLAAFMGIALDVRLVSVGAPPDTFVRLEREYG